MKYLFPLLISLFFIVGNEAHGQFLWKKEDKGPDPVNSSKPKKKRKRKSRAQMRDSFTGERKKRPNIASNGDPKIMSKKENYIFSTSKKDLNFRNSQAGFSTKAKRSRISTSKPKGKNRGSTSDKRSARERKRVRGAK